MIRYTTTLVAASALAALLGTTSLAMAQSAPEVPRNRTLISQGWDFYNQVPSVDNFNPYAGVLLHQRNSLHYTVNEVLFYTNHNTNETTGWQADSYSYNDDFTEVTLKLRDGVKWSDGEAFTAEDVAFTFDMLKGAAPDLLFSSQIAEWVASATVVDPLTVLIKLNKPGPAGSRTSSLPASRRASSPCPSISGTARTPRPSLISTSPRVGRSAPAPTSW